MTQCESCGAKSADGYFLMDVLTYEGGSAILCDDCAAADRKLEKLVGELVDLPSCEERTRIVDTVTISADLVNALRAHDLAQCVLCAATKKTVQEDRLYVHAGAVCCEQEVA